ncbi:brachyurin-like [Daphnia pulex]|uniref:brachyurin-like n=1 Tax=Daphnia pulex TaxID=6669 RepID=UPI001EDDEEC7|nr:brachyurin-like [Daphnia pulex]
MKFLAVVLALAVVAQAAVNMPHKKIFPRGELFPRAQVPQGPGYFTPTKVAPTVDTRGFCGQSKVDSSRIVGGEEAIPHEFPWQVSVLIDGSGFCGGSLISPDWVLTAAHCADGAGRFLITLGDHDRTVVEPSQVAVSTTTYTVHPGWNSATLADDLALIRLPSPVTLTPEVQPICLAPATEPDHVGDTLLVSGWGKTADGALQGISDVLMKVTAPGITTAECAATYGDIITDNILCIDTTGGKGSCNGDSGGPLSFVNAGVYNQVGIVSFGARAGCAEGFPAGFTRVSSYTQWISDTTGLIF